MPPKKKPSPQKLPTPIASVKHAGKHANIPTEGLQNFVAEEEKNPNTMLYPCDLLLDSQLVPEVSGEARKDKATKMEAAHNLWAPAINNHNAFGHWVFLEIVDPRDAKNTIHSFLTNKVQPELSLFHNS
jgi:hypothetical protein